MADRAATGNPINPQNGPDPERSLFEDLLGLLPRLADRTSSQIQFSRSLLTMLPCARTLFDSGGAEKDLGAPEHEAPQAADVLTVLASDKSDETADAEPEATLQASVVVPPAAELAIPEYDSLAASQVVPRLTTLSVIELRAISAYESAHRNRRTILNRVTALLAD